MAALFGSPLKAIDDCDIPYTSSIPTYPSIALYSFGISGQNVPQKNINFPFTTTHPMDYHYNCDILKRDEAQFVSEDEIGIVTLSDLIKVTNLTATSDYQIYNVLGQLMQAGITSSDISTTQLPKGVYILRLENGKTFKFVK